jgi:hypothetical protein
MISKILSLPNLKHEHPVWAHFNNAKLHPGGGMPGSLGIAQRARKKDDKKSPLVRIAPSQVRQYLSKWGCRSRLQNDARANCSERCFAVRKLDTHHQR